MRLGKAACGCHMVVCEGSQVSGVRQERSVTWHWCVSVTQPAGAIGAIGSRVVHRGQRGVRVLGHRPLVGPFTGHPLPALLTQPAVVLCGHHL